MRTEAEGTLGGWLDDRLPVSNGWLRRLVDERVPRHLRGWWFALGGTPAYLLAVQVVTGILLAFYYETAPRAAYESVRYISEEAAFGWYLRSVHKWAGTLMIAAVILHQIRVFFTGAYRKPRELNWMIGCLLLFCTLLVGFTGYSLVYDQQSFWGVTVGVNIAQGVPLVGDLLKNLMLGGDAYNARTLARFFILHAAILPVFMIALVVLHLVLVRIQGVSEPTLGERRGGPVEKIALYPDHVYTELVVCLTLMVLLTVLACLFPATMGPPADPNVTPEEVKPEWFFYAAFRWLKLFTRTGALLSLGLVVLAMFAWPLIDEEIRRRTRFPDASLWIGLAGVLAIVGLTLWEAFARH